MGSLFANNIIFEGKNYIKSSMASIDINLSDKNKAEIINRYKDLENSKDCIYIKGSFASNNSIK